VTLQTWRRWEHDVEREGMRFAAAPEYHVFPTRERPLTPYQAVERATRETAALVRDVAPHAVVADILTLAPALAAELAGEIADGWIPTLFSPEHVAEFVPLLEEGAARSGRSLDGFDIAPQVNVCITENLESGRNLMRPFIALYVGGMGSREKNFYNQLVGRYGFEEEARDVQDLYLDGKREEAMARLSDELIDTVSICGPPEHVRERLAVYRDAGVGTLGVSPLAFTKDDRLEQLRLIAELAA
jgi:alkanesulfonate monooxygenase SsuD/methylene tetrahydromethanopterin reductase-like flavin-dependent oxidoreductase (luciferase family)